MKTLLKNFCLMFALVLVAACAQTVTCPDGTIVGALSECADVKDEAPAEPETNTQEDQIIEPIVEPEEPEPQKVLTEEVQELKTKGQKVTNYQFTYAELPENKANRKYFVRGDYARVELYTPARREKGSYDVVYLDLVNKKAVAYCEQGNHVICSDKSTPVSKPDFDEYIFELPHQIIRNLDNGEKISSLTFDDQGADVIRAEHNGKPARLIIHRFYGIPLAIEYFETDNYEGEPSGYEFRDAAFNSVKEEQVTPPGGW